MDGYAPKKMSGSTGAQLTQAFQFTLNPNLSSGERHLVQQIKHSEDPPKYNHYPGSNPFRTDPGMFRYNQGAQDVLDRLQSQYGNPSFPQ